MAQLAGSVAEHSAYHHGEVGLGGGGVAGMVLEGQRLFIYVGLEVPNTAHVIKVVVFTYILDNVMKIGKV